MYPVCSLHFVPGLHFVSGLHSAACSLNFALTGIHGTNTVYIISSVMHAFWLVLTYDILEDRRIDDKLFLILYYIKQIDSKLTCVCSVIDHRGHQNVVRTSVTHLAVPHVPLFCSDHILMSFVIYYWTDTWQLGIYLIIIFGNSYLHNTLNWPQHTRVCELIQHFCSFPH